MRVEVRDLGFGISERRTYDNDDKLVEIRKILPALESEIKLFPIKKSAGTFGGE